MYCVVGKVSWKHWGVRVKRRWKTGGGVWTTEGRFSLLQTSCSKSFGQWLVLRHTWNVVRIKYLVKVFFWEKRKGNQRKPQTEVLGRKAMNFNPLLTFTFSMPARSLSAPMDHGILLLELSIELCLSCESFHGLVSMLCFSLIPVMSHLYLGFSSPRFLLLLHTHHAVSRLT